MNNHDDRSHPAQADRPAGSSNTHLVYVGLLLVIIIGLMAVLWSRERRLRATAEANVARLSTENESLRTKNDSLRKAIGAIRAFQTPTTRSAGRD